jgi:hypothetical protein
MRARSALAGARSGAGMRAAAETLIALIGLTTWY